ncbi:MAG: xanthine dehydrogenase family protein molybdopterin-binding subunit [Chloroflexota bacterium]|nr:xanthine dehydrogenase family protein molybdopterin-binding subunit [Chloroflexota bacterium]
MLQFPSVGAAGADFLYLEVGTVAAERFFGQRVRRFEDPRLLAGKGAFIEDLRLPGLLHAAFVRSPYAHARVASIPTEAARDVPGVVAVFTAADFELRPTPTVVPHPAYRPCSQPPLASGTVRFVGEPLAVVVARDRYAAEDGAAAIAAELDLEPLDVVADAFAALAPDAPLLHAELGDNLAGAWEVSVGDVDGAFAQADRIVRGRFDVQRYTGMPIETRGVMATVDPISGRLTVWSSTQWPHTVRQALAESLGRPEHQIRVIAPNLGGGFGVKQDIYPEETIIPLVAERLGQPVRWVETRREHFTGTAHSRQQSHEVELTVTNDGVVLGLRAIVTADLGAYTRGLGLLCPSITAGSLLGPYRLRHYRCVVRCALTNKAPTGAYRGAGGPEAVFALERAMDLVAQELGLDPAQVRRRNFIRPDEFPWHTGLGTAQLPVVYDSGEYAAGLDRALELADYAGWRERQAVARAAGRFIGVGLASYVLLGGLGPYESAEVRVDPSGDVVVTTGALPHGQGTDTALAQIVADELRTVPERVAVRHGDTDQIPYGIGTYASRNAVVAGSAVAVAASLVREKAARLATYLLETAESDLELVDGAFHVRGIPERSVTLAQLAAAAAPDRPLPEGMEPELAARHYFQAPLPTFSSGTQVAVVEVDPDSGHVTILDYVSVNDAGPLINPTIVDGQIQGGIAQGIGGALYEEIAYDEIGQPAGSFLDYAIPRATDIPDVRQDHRYTPSPLNPLGVKGLGEGGTLAPPPVLASAVEDALAPLGVRVTRTPLTASHVWRLCQEAAGGEAPAS